MKNNYVTRAAVAALAISLAVPATADQKVKTKSNIKNDRVQGTLSNSCSISGTADAVTIDARFSNLFVDGSQEATVSLAVEAKGKGGPMIATYDVKTMKARTSGGAPAQSCANAPAAQDRSINTKGAGANDRTNQPIIEKEVKDQTCAVSGDADNPVVSVHFSFPTPSGKATFKEFTVTKRSDAAAKGGVAPDGENMLICLTESGEASSVAVKGSWNLKENVK